MKRFFKKIISKIFFKPVSLFSNTSFSNLFFAEIEKRVNKNNPEEALKFLFDIDNKLYLLEGLNSIRYGKGLHTKHKHINYHNFFIENINIGSRIIDVGCGNGALAADIIDNVKDVSIYAIDIVKGNIDKALKEYNRKNINYICGNALIDLPNENFDIIVLSNVLEHIEKRVDFLKELQNQYKPNKFLIRVPVFERDWRVPLKEELGLDYRLDDTHFIEYRNDEFFNEIKEAGLEVVHYKINWGEIWAEVKKKVG